MTPWSRHSAATAAAVRQRSRHKNFLDPIVVSGLQWSSGERTRAETVLKGGIDTEPIRSRMTRFGFAAENWKPWRMYDGLEVLVPGGFAVTIDDKGDTLMYPQSDLSAPPSARMPKDAYFFDSIVRQQPIDEDKLRPEDNLEEYKPISDLDLDYWERVARDAA